MAIDDRSSAFRHILIKLGQTDSDVPADAKLVQSIAEPIENLGKLLHGKAKTNIAAGTDADRQNLVEIEQLLDDVSELILGAYFYSEEHLSKDWKTVVEALSILSQLTVLNDARAACRTYRRIFRYEEPETKLSAHELYGYDQIYIKLASLLDKLSYELTETSASLIEVVKISLEKESDSSQ